MPANPNERAHGVERVFQHCGDDLVAAGEVHVRRSPRLADAVDVQAEDPALELAILIRRLWLIASRYLFVVRETNRIRKGRHPLRPRLVALVEHGQQAGVFDSRIPALAVNDLIDGLMYALIEAVTAGDVQPEQAPEMFGVAALGVAGLPRGRAWQLVRRAASQADTQG